MLNSVAVITLTRRRPELLQRAIRSVQQQNCAGRIEHLLVVDDCLDTKHMLEHKKDLPDNIVWRWLPRMQHEQSGPRRVAELRNYAVREARSQWIAFLDDDNEFESNHIGSLIKCAEHNQCRGVHSHMQIFWPDGTPYLEPRMPWWRDREEAEHLYQELLKEGVFHPNSNIVTDRVDPWNCANPVRTVDMGEWLFDKSLLMEYPFCEVYSNEDWVKITTEDDKLLDTLVEHRIQIACTNIASLKYYLGGYSNSFNGQDDWHISNNS